MSFYVRARFDVRDERRPEFEEAVRALRAQAEEEPGTLAYRWFADGPGGYLVIEEYADAAAALAHNQRGAEPLARVAQCADLVFAEVYGSAGPELREWVESHPQVTAFPEVRPGG
ncbi:antibiotic biosynthesis monooxygenase [Actinomadura sp. ATCC 31491]|uniref:Antibiotic biosynthesis monooxygenase n=1 Tax=Actinomadura luzonensis TaxID=2805427 RepID=A0ABT0G3H5_9ACTN|nr:antibiotic biosynthesis monooxygenase family protein [Actinomadura luzonensis]MCK2219156.1 antibiotic biosynthesis monooxygenase [Actinomadura luzonensis]